MQTWIRCKPVENKTCCYERLTVAWSKMNAAIRHNGVISCAILSESCGDNSTLTWLEVKGKSIFGDNLRHVYLMSLGKHGKTFHHNYICAHHNDNENKRVQFQEHSQLKGHESIINFELDRLWDLLKIDANLDTQSSMLKCCVFVAKEHIF